MDTGSILGLVIMILGLITFLTIVALTEFHSLRKQIEDLKLQTKQSKDYINDLYNIVDKLNNNINLTKQKSGKEPINIHKPDLHYFANCPICNAVVSDRDSYCDRCGQKIDWKDKSRGDTYEGNT